MIFPNIQVQPHWLAALERAKEMLMLSSCRWVCTAVNNGVEPEVEKEICEAIREAITPAAFVSTWYVY